MRIELEKVFAKQRNIKGHTVLVSGELFIPKETRKKIITLEQYKDMVDNTEKRV